MPELLEDIEEVALKDDNVYKHKVILFNDDFNTFDHVERCLMEICFLTSEQAQKLTFQIHHNGKGVCYQGSLEACETVAEKLTAQDLTVSVE